VYKYGITSVSPPTYRAGQSLRQCDRERYTNNTCNIVRIIQFSIRYQARVWEWSQCARYVVKYDKRSLA
jgi:hypothetical protein